MATHRVPILLASLATAGGALLVCSTRTLGDGGPGRAGVAPASTSAPAAVVVPVPADVLATAPASRPARAVPLFDALLHTKKPAPAQLRLKPIYVVYESSLWRPGAPPDEPDDVAVEAVADAIGRAGVVQAGTPVCIDIERWPLNSRLVGVEAVEQSVRKLARVARIIRGRNPGVKLGFYGAPPVCDYWTPFRLWHALSDRKAGRPNGANVPALEAEYRAWQESNRLLIDRLGPHVDVVFPSLYQFYEDADGWEVYARANISEARRAGKPVYPFLAFRYHESEARLKSALLPEPSWRRQLEVTSGTCDGVVLWGGFGERWDPWQPWWQTTARFFD